MNGADVNGADVNSASGADVSGTDVVGGCWDITGGTPKEPGMCSVLWDGLGGEWWLC